MFSLVTFVGVHLFARALGVGLSGAQSSHKSFHINRVTITDQYPSILFNH